MSAESTKKRRKIFRCRFLDYRGVEIECVEGVTAPNWRRPAIVLNGVPYQFTLAGEWTWVYRSKTAVPRLVGGTGGSSRVKQGGK